MIAGAGLQFQAGVPITVLPLEFPEHVNPRNMSKQAPSRRKDDGARRAHSREAATGANAERVGPEHARPARRPPLILRPLLWVKRLLAIDVRLQRRGFRFQVVFVRPGTDPEPAPPVVACEVTVAAAPANPMRDQLRRLLAQHAKTRGLMRHLGFIERALMISGPQALDDLPAEVVKKGLAQLESLVGDWSNAGLSELRARLVVAADAHEAANRQFQPTNSKLSDFFVPQRIEVSEGTASDFEELERIWIEHVPGVASGAAQRAASAQPAAATRGPKSADAARP